MLARPGSAPMVARCSASAGSWASTPCGSFSIMSLVRSPAIDKTSAALSGEVFVMSVSNSCADMPLIISVALPSGMEISASLAASAEGMAASMSPALALDIRVNMSANCHGSASDSTVAEMCGSAWRLYSANTSADVYGAWPCTADNGIAAIISAALPGLGSFLTFCRRAVRLS